MDNQNKKIFFPLFYRYATDLAALSKEEIGELFFAILASKGSMPPKEPLNPGLQAIYNLLINDVNVFFEKNMRKTIYKKEEKPKENKRYGDFDPDEMFQKALERSYANMNNKCVFSFRKKKPLTKVKSLAFTILRF